MDKPSTRRALSLGVRGMWAAVLLLAPGALLRVSGGDDAAARRTARVLGARHLAQAALLARSASRGAWDVGAAVDGLHASSMVLLGALVPTQRRTCLVDAVVEGGITTLTLGARP